MIIRVDTDVAPQQIDSADCLIITVSAQNGAPRQHYMGVLCLKKSTCAD